MNQSEQPPFDVVAMTGIAKSFGGVAALEDVDLWCTKAKFTPYWVGMALENPRFPGNPVRGLGDQATRCYDKMLRKEQAKRPCGCGRAFPDGSAIAITKGASQQIGA